MRLELKTGPAIEAVTMAGIKTYGNVNTDSKDTAINENIPGVISVVENITGRRMIDQSVYIFLDAEEYYSRLNGRKNSIVLSTLNVSAITEVQEFDRNNISTVITASDYRLSGNQFSDACKLVFNDNVSQPVTTNLRRVDSIRIEVVCGYGSQVTDIPQPLRAAMKILANHWLQFGQMAQTDGVRMTPLNFDANILNYRSSENYF